MSPGDIIAVQGRGWLSRGIQSATHSPVSHVGMVIGVEPEVVIEALARVRTRPLADTLTDCDHAWLLCDRMVSDGDRVKLVAAACRFSAESYGYLDLLLQVLDATLHTHWFTGHLTWWLSRWPICSAVVGFAYAQIGVKLGRDPHSLTPADVMACARTSRGFDIMPLK